MRIMFSIISIVYLCLSIHKLDLAFGQSFDVRDCNTPKDSGPCKGIFPMYFYDNQTDSCNPFNYGGCGGNNNRFSTKEECEGSCMTQELQPISQNETSDSCVLNVTVGPCKALFRRFYYDKDNGKCTDFIYGGCDGNDNNFETIEDCEKRCVLKNSNNEKTSICELNVDSGPCEALIERYFFDKNTGQCLKFNYGGCQGNGNNFNTYESCQQFCVNRTESSIKSS